MQLSFWKKFVLPFCGFVIQENVGKLFKQICPFYFGLLIFLELYLVTGMKEWLKVLICEDFEDSLYNAENGGKCVVFWKNTFSIKRIHRNCAFKSHCPSIGILIKKSCFIALCFPDNFTIRKGGSLLLPTCLCFIQ